MEFLIGTAARRSDAQANAGSRKSERRVYGKHSRDQSRARAHRRAKPATSQTVNSGTCCSNEPLGRIKPVTKVGSCLPRTIFILGSLNITRSVLHGSLALFEYCTTWRTVIRSYYFQ